MSDFNRGSARPVIVDRADMAVDAGLRQFMLGVYNKVALGLVVSAAMAWLTGMFPPVRDYLARLQAANGTGPPPGECPFVCTPLCAAHRSLSTRRL